MNGLETRLRQIITNLGGTLPAESSHLGVYLNAILTALGGTARSIFSSLEDYLKDILTLIGGTKGTSDDPLKAYLDGILAALPEGEPLADITLKDYLDAFIARTGNVGIVDLGTLTWNKYTSGSNWLFYANVPDGKTYGGQIGVAVNYSISGTDYTVNKRTNNGSGAVSGADKNTYWDATNPQILIKDLSYSDAAAFKTAMSGKILIHQKSDAYVHIKCADLTITRSDTRKFVTEQLNDFIHCDDGTKAEGMTTNDPTVEIRTYNTSTTSVKNIFVGVRNLVLYPSNRYLTYFYGFNSDTVEDFKEEIKDLVLTYRVKSDVYNTVKIKDYPAADLVYANNMLYIKVGDKIKSGVYSVGSAIINNTSLTNQGTEAITSGHYKYNPETVYGNCIAIKDTYCASLEEFLAKYGGCTFFYEKQ